MSTRHTPGIWVIDSDPDERLYVAQEYRDKPGGRICEVFQNCLVDDYKQRANAKLISASPDLLAVALEALHVIRVIKPPKNGNGTIVRLEEAILKATGEKA